MTNHKGVTMCMFVLVCVVLVQSVCLAQERFVLKSELRTNFSEGGSVSAFTGYHYDTRGNRIERRVFDGIDSTVALMSSVKYSYDAQDRCIEELLVEAGGDTLSIVRYTWGADGLISAVTLSKDGRVRYSDSLRYTGGLQRAQERYNASGVLTWYHHYGYQNGLLTTDSLYEPDGSSGFTPMQARLLSHNANSTIATEAQWRVSGGTWYLISTTVMGYADDKLASATTYEGDGGSLRLVDSLAYTVDSWGNRTKEEHFDNEQTKTYEIVFTWFDTQMTVTIARAAGAVHPNIAWRNGRVELGRPVSGSLLLCSIDGRRVYGQRLTNENFVALPSGLSAGRYVAMIRGTVNQSLSITINN